jgi:hypothetical protein
MDGDLDNFIEAYLKKKQLEKEAAGRRQSGQEVKPRLT